MNDWRTDSRADQRDASLGDQIGRVVEDGKAFAKAQIDLYRQEAAYVGKSLPMPAVLGVLAILLGVASLILLLVALVFALAPLVGPAWAALIVALASAALAGVLAWVVVHRGRAIVAELRKNR